MQDKPNMKSKAFWGAVLVGFSGILTVLGNYLNGTMGLAEALTGGMASVGAFLAIFGIRAKLAE